ncbi:LytR C-terminal domain-containing protein [Streptomyces sp. NPDC048208]|uniref:LytR C-terminal domain-containing protein n=1 Tax=unclassified Streptomyces TaxID=2593676 RepID=UPI001F21E5BF|nr:LytR C-terminal domain-containing protein [Streptomyces sp. SID4982]
MSMLTPPGMGGKYRITGDTYPRMRPPRRRGRLVAAVVASVAALGVAGWGTLQLIDVFTGGDGSVSGHAADCRTKVAKAAPVKALPKPGTITVNVYNATTRSGLAKQTADELKKRGFKIGDVGNADKQFDKKVKGTGMLIGPASALDSTLPVLSTQLTGAERRTDAARKGAALDLVIGDGFKTLTQRPAADSAVTRLTAPEQVAAVTTAKKKTC